MENNTIRELLDAPRKHLVVPKDEEWRVDARDERFRGILHRVQVRTYEDLCTLHLIPNRLSEKDVRQAMADDDAEALAAARSHLQTGSRLCSCNTETGAAHAAGPMAYRAGLRATYNAIRKFYNPTLAKVYSKAMGSTVAWDSLAVAIVAGWAKKVTDPLSLIPLWVLFLEDLEIQNNATFYTGPVNHLSAKAIKIHVGGKIKIQSSGIKIWCKSAQGNLP